MASRNPVLSDKVLTTASSADAAMSTIDTTHDWSAPPVPGKTMTIEGTARTSLFLIVLTIAAGAFGWAQVSETLFTDDLTGQVGVAVNYSAAWLFVPMIIGLIAVLVATFKPAVAAPASIVYALAEGTALGVISHVYDSRYDGIVVQAIIATGAVFAVMATLYSTRLLRPTPRMTKAIMAATIGIMLTYALRWIGSMFGANLRFWDNAGPVGIVISLVIVGVAASNLLLDFDFIERGANGRLPKNYQWVGALGLLVTLVWLYLEMLRLISKLRD